MLMIISIFFVIYKDLGHKILEYLNGTDFLNITKLGMHVKFFQEAARRKLLTLRGSEFVQTQLPVDWLEIYEILLYSERPSAGICCASRRNDMITINFFEEKCDNKNDMYMLGILGALLGENYDLIDYFIQKGGKPNPHWLMIFTHLIKMENKPLLMSKFY
jgi:hypothetical protein